MIKILCLLIITSCSDNKDGTIDSPKAQFLDTTKIAIIPINDKLNQTYKLFETAIKTDLSDQEIEQIDYLLTKRIHSYNVDQEQQYQLVKKNYPKAKWRKRDFVINLSKYKRQYVVTTNKNGEKEVWVNCFCDSWDLDWRSEVLFVFDRGNCYFNIKFNLSTNEYSEFFVNGEA